MVQQKVLSLLWCCLLFSFNGIFSLSDFAREKGFVYLHEIDPTIVTSVRYCTNDNFMGMQVNGYKKQVIILTQQAALALKQVQEELKKDGYCLVVYDAYRPQEAVDHFVWWCGQTEKTEKKKEYYSIVNKEDMLGFYIASKSGHSRGSTMDLTIIPLGQSVHSISVEDRILSDGREIAFLNDGTLDMGSSFDCFDEVSHTHTTLIEEQCRNRRTYLKNVMEKDGFKNYPYEWWHFTLENEPYPASEDSSYFNFSVE